MLLYTVTRVIPAFVGRTKQYRTSSEVFTFQSCCITCFHVLYVSIFLHYACNACRTRYHALELEQRKYYIFLLLQLNRTINLGKSRVASPTRRKSNLYLTWNVQERSAVILVFLLSRHFDECRSRESSSYSPFRLRI